MDTTFTTLPQVPLEYDVLLVANSHYASPKDRIARAVKNGDVLRIRHGLYYPSSNVASINQESRWLIANQLYGPSYVSCQALLASYGIIPEAVPTITSCCIHRARCIDTTLGEFSYSKVPRSYFSVGLQITATNAIAASPAKALCDMIAGKRSGRIQSKKALMEFLIQDLRVDMGALDAAQPRRAVLRTVREVAELGFKESEYRLLCKVLEEL
jgi:hypothetical protein